MSDVLPCCHSATFLVSLSTSTFMASTCLKLTPCNRVCLCGSLLFCIGGFMLVLAALGIYANMSRSWFLMGIAFLVAAALCFTMVFVSMGAMMMATSTMDPIGTAVEKAWEKGLRKELELADAVSLDSVKETQSLVYCKDEATTTRCAHSTTPRDGGCHIQTRSGK